MNKVLSKMRGDRVIWSVVLVLALISLLGVYSFTRSLAYKMDKDSAFYLRKHLSFLVVGLAIIYLVHRVNYTKFARLSVLAYAISVPLLLYTLVNGAKINGGARWIKIYGTGLTFQTSDFAKLVLFMFLARLLSIKQGSIKDFKKGFLPVLVPVAITCALIAPANLSTALMLGATCCILFFIGRVQLKHIGMLAMAGILGFVLLFTVCKVFHIGRAETWEKRWADFSGGKGGQKKEEVFQVQQAKIAIANGGVFGRGPGHSLQRDYLPEAYSDFIFSSIIEEYGLVGGAILVLLYLTFLWRSIILFRRCPYAFGAFLAVGLSITLVFQAMLNMAVNVHLVPVTGLTLPMVSMGGSSIWFTSVAIGIVLSVSRYVDEMEGKDVPPIPAKGSTLHIEVPDEDEDEEESANLKELIPSKPRRSKKEPALAL